MAPSDDRAKRWLRAAPAVSLAILAALVGPAAVAQQTAQQPAPPPIAAATAVDEVIVPGLRHLELRRGAPSAGDRYRVRVASFDDQSEASVALGRLEAAGVEPLVWYEGGGYHLAVGELASRRAAMEVRDRLLTAGFAPPLTVEEHAHDLTDPGGPWAIHVLAADPARVRPVVAHAYDATIGVETTRSLARRRAALAAVNGGYYITQGLLRGEPQGVLRIDGALLSEPDRGRAAVGFISDGATTRAVFGRLAWRATAVTAGGSAIVIDGVDRQRGAAEVVLYTPHFHRTTLTDPGGAEVVLDGGRVVAVRDGAASSEIPAGGAVLSFGPDAADRHLGDLALGDAVEIETRLEPLLPDQEGVWDGATMILGGGPLLLLAGERVEDPGAESISRVFSLARHPRTAAAVRADGTLLLLTVDGRQPGTSVGMSLRELTDLLFELGAVAAVNLDGGGSTTMVIGERVVNTPSDSGGERENGDAILLFPADGAGRSR